MTIKYNQLLVIQKSFDALVLGNFEMSRVIEIAKFIKNVIEPEIKLFNELRLKLCEKYSEKDSENKPIIENDSYKMTDEKKYGFTLDFTKLSNNEIDIDFTPFNEDEIIQAFEGMKSNPIIYMSLQSNGFIA